MNYRKKKRPKYATAVLVVGLALSLGSCTSVTYNPDGTVVKQEIDEQSIQLAAMATVGAWAASQKQGINQTDAEALKVILDSIEEYHGDGSEIDPMKWNEAINEQVPLRWRGLATVLVATTSYQLKKYGVSTEKLTPSSDAMKVMRALRDGAKMGLAPYLGKGKMVG